MRHAAAVFAAAAVLLVTGGCGSGEVDTTPEEATVSSLRLPSQIVGLRIEPEEVRPQDLEAIDRPYVDNIAVFSLRDEKLLRATLQVARFNRAARPDDESFRGEIIGLLGGQRPFELRVSGEEINATTGTSQQIYSWFGGRAMFVLSIQQDYEFPRTLLRRLVELDMAL